MSSPPTTAPSGTSTRTRWASSWNFWPASPGGTTSRQTSLPRAAGGEEPAAGDGCAARIGLVRLTVFFEGVSQIGQPGAAKVDLPQFVGQQSAQRHQPARDLLQHQTLIAPFREAAQQFLHFVRR